MLKLVINKVYFKLGANSLAVHILYLYLNHFNVHTVAIRNQFGLNYIIHADMFLLLLSHIGNNIFQIDVCETVFGERLDLPMWYSRSYL